MSKRITKQWNNTYNLGPKRAQNICRQNEFELETRSKTETCDKDADADETYHDDSADPYYDEVPTHVAD